MSIDGSKIILKELFSDDYFFRIPIYQRPYSWGEEQWEELFEDLYNAERGNEYFLGTIILHKTSTLGTCSMYDIIDGQQRLTTLQILFACLRDRIDKDSYSDTLHKYIFKEDNELEGIPERSKLEVREIQLFRNIIQIKGGTKNINFIKQNKEQQNIIQAIEYFSLKIEEINNQSLLETFAQFLVQKCVMLYLITENFQDAFRLFTIVNDRGLQLRRIDILKSINLVPKIIENDVEREYYSKLWDNMENDLGADIFENLISLIRTIIVKERAKEDLYKEFENGVFGKYHLNKGKEFIDYINEYKKIYEGFFINQDYDLDSDIGESNEFWNIISILKEYFPANEWMSCLMLYYKKFKTNNIMMFIKKLEHKVISDWVTGLTPSKRSINIYNILKVVESNTDTNSILKKQVFNIETVKYRGVLNKDVYGKRFIKYILLKLEIMSSDNMSKRKFGTISVEHVLPQNPKLTSQWLVDFSSKELKIWNNKIANLILLSKNKNSRASNKDFKDKKELYLKPRISDLNRSLQVISYDKWDISVLEMRQKDIINKLVKNEY